MAEIVIEAAVPEDIPEAAFLLSRAMIGLPETEVVFRGRRDRFERVFQIVFKHTPESILIARDAGQIVGVMRMAEWPRCQTPPLQALKMLPSMIRALGGTFPRAAKFRSIWAGQDPKKPHWHLDPLGVLPGRQGEGIGSRLMEHFCAHVDQLGSAAYLETGTRDNVRLYERFGFKITGEVSVFGVPTWLMWRPAREKTG